MITLEAKPEAFALDLRRAAVLVIDMQNDFASPGGMFERAGIDINGIAAAAAATRPVLQAARGAGIPVVYVKMEHAPDLSDAGPADSPHWIKHVPMRVGETVTAPDGSESRILVRGTWNTEILEELAPQPGELVVSKHRYSAFFETELDDVLRGLGATHLLVTGSRRASASSRPCETRCSATTRASCSRTAPPSQLAPRSPGRTTNRRCSPRQHSERRPQHVLAGVSVRMARDPGRGRALERRARLRPSRARLRPPQPADA